MRASSICLMALTVAAFSLTGAHAERLSEPPSPEDAPLLVAGEPQHGRVQPIDVIAGHVWAVPALVHGLQHEDAEMRARCSFLLGQIASQDAVDGLKAALDDPDRQVRIFAGIALARMGNFDGLGAARAAYYGNRWWIRYWAVDALARLDRVPEVALNDPDPLVRTLAAEGDRGLWGPVTPAVAYDGPEDATVAEIIFTLGNYLIAETDWWWHAGHYEQIIRGKETVVWLDPTWLEGLTNSAYLYWSLGRDVEALATYRRAVSMHPDEWEAHFELGFYYFNAQKRFEDAIPLLGRARELGSPPTQSRMHAHALERAGYQSEALEVWRELLEEQPDDLVARRNYERLKAIVESG